MQELAVESVTFLSNHTRTVKNKALEEGAAILQQLAEKAVTEAKQASDEATAAKRKKAKGKPVDPVEIEPQVPGLNGVALPDGLIAVEHGHVVLSKFKDLTGESSERLDKVNFVPLLKVGMGGCGSFGLPNRGS
jgi:hypothetical protein